MIAAVVRRQQAIGLGGITQGPVEINDIIEVAGGTNPGVDNLPVTLVGRPRVIVTGTGMWRDGCADYSNAVRVYAKDDLLICRQYAAHQCAVIGCGNFAGASESTQVIDAFEDDEPVDTGLSQHIAIYASQGVGTESIGE